MPPKKPMNLGPNSVYAPAHKEGPGGQQRLFDLPPSKTEERMANERVPEERRTWDDMRKTQTSPGRGSSQEHVNQMLAEQGVTGRGARKRLRDLHGRAVERADGSEPEGQRFYAEDQPDRFEHDAKYFSAMAGVDIPYRVIVGVNAVLSPKTSLGTKSGLQTNREAAYMIMKHVISGKKGIPDGVPGLTANHIKAADLFRQHLATGIHPLDMTNKKGRPLVSGPKVEAYYSNYMDPARVTTDIQHARAVFGPSVRSDPSPEELAYKKMMLKTNKKADNKKVIKTPAEQLLESPGVHEFSAHHTQHVAGEVGFAPAELQSVIWHQVKHERGEAAAPEMRPLFDSRKKPKSQGRQGQLFNDKRYKKK